MHVSPLKIYFQYRLTCPVYTSPLPWPQMHWGEGWEAENTSTSEVLGVSQSRGQGVRNTRSGPGFSQTWIWEACLALVNKTLVIWNKWELIICVFLLCTLIGASFSFLGGIFPVIGFVNLKGKTVVQVQSVVSGCGHAKSKAWIKLTGKEEDPGNWHF